MQQLLRRYVLAFAAILGGLTVNAQCTDLFFSEYIEGSSNNKAIEIYNPTSNAIDLSNYSIERFNNGGVTPSGTLNFPAGTMVAAGDVYVAGNSGAIAGITNESDTLSAITFFNGDDAMVLHNLMTGDTLDIIGYVGQDPGASWTVGTGGTQNFTLVRADSVQQGTTDWALSTSQWIVNPIDTTMFLGSHTMLACGPPPPPTGTGPCVNLFFSEYIEGSSSNKALEIYNPTGQDVDLTDYVIYRANNGSLTPTDSIFLQGTLLAGDVHVVGNPSAIAAIAAETDTTHSLTFFNGDDAIVMVQISTGDTLDVIGEVGVDPGAGWTVGSGATNNFTLVRMISVNQGTTSWVTGVTEWDVFPIDMVDSLGAHTMTACGAGPVDPTVFFTMSTQTVSENVGTVTVTVGINNENANPTSVDVVLNVGSSTATDPADFTYTTPTTVTFPANDNTPQTVTITIVDDAMQETDEDIVVDLSNATNNAGIGTSTQTITIQDDDAPGPGNTGSCSDLFFSEYAEGSSNNKALEIYNPTLADIDLSDYEVQRFTNGSATASGTYTFPAGTIITAGGTYIIANASADPTILAIADTTNAATFYNGDDAVVLMNVSTADTLDIIGVVGQDPGTNWTVGTGATSEYTLVRMVHVQDGETDWAVSSTQWEVFPQNTWTDLGAHTMNSCFGGPVVSMDMATVSVNENAGTVTVQVNIANEDANPTSVDVVLGAASTATDPSDFTYTTPTTVTFPGGSNTPQTVTVTIVDDATPEALETVVLELMNPTNGATAAGDTVTTITIIDDDATSIEFDTIAATFDESAGTITAQVNISAAPAANTDVTFTATVASTAVGGGTDYTIVSASPITFTAGNGAAQDISITINDDAISENAETIVLQLSSPTAGAFLGQDSIMTITITDNDINTCDIADVTGIDAAGVADSIGVFCSISGVVYGVNMRTTGLQFTLIDPTDGIGVFSSTNDFGYTVTEGDSIEIQGTIDQFNGLTQITPDTVIFHTANNNLKIPTVVTALDEATESDLVRIDDVWLVDVAQWTGAGSGFNVDITDGTNTYTMRIDAEVDLYSLPAPTGHFNLCGIGGQFDSSSPFDEGYQIFPRYNDDIKIIVDLGADFTACGDATLDAGWADVVWSTTATSQTISVTADGTYYVDATYGTSTASDTVVVTILPDMNPAITCDNDDPCVNFLEPSNFTGAGTGSTSWDWNFGDGNTSSQQNPTHTYTADGTYTVTLVVSDGVCTDSTTFTVNAQICGGIEEFDGSEIKVYPTLTEGLLNIDMTLATVQDIDMQITDLQGRVVWSKGFGAVSTMSTNVQLQDAAPGMYFLVVQGANKQSTIRFIKR